MPTTAVAEHDDGQHHAHHGVVASPVHILSDPDQPEEVLGSWVHGNLDELAEAYATAEPFPHVVIDNFWSDAFVAEMAGVFPDPRKDRKGWHLYNNPLERKFANNDFATFPEPISRAFSLLQSEAFVQIMRRITRIDNLESDPYLHGAGMHASPNTASLDMHLDYSIHPTSGKERRVNIINYLSPDWDQAWGGSLQLFGHDDTTNSMTRCVTRIAPLFNRVALFRTTDISYHGFPDPIQCPPERLRKSLAVYYVSPPRPEAAHRYKARYYPRPGDAKHEGLDKLREIRVTRWITPADIQEHTPEWNQALEW